MKKLIALQGSVAGTHSSKLYELIYLNDVIYVFITYSYDGTLKIEEIRDSDYHIGKNIFKDVIINPLQFKYHNYENFVGVWRCNILSNHVFESDKYYSHALQLHIEKNNIYKKYSDLRDKLKFFFKELKL